MSTSEALSANANPRRQPGPTHVKNLAGFRHGLWVFVLAAGVGAAAMTVANEGLDGLGTPNGLKVLIGWSFAGSGLYAWGRRPENRLGPLMTAVGCAYLLAQILIQAHSSPLFTAGIWLSDAWVVVFVCFLLAFPHGRLTPGFDLFVIGMFALMAFPLELAWLLFFDDRREPGERARGLAERPSRRQHRLRTTGSGHGGLRRPGHHLDEALDPSRARRSGVRSCPYSSVPSASS